MVLQSPGKQDHADAKTKPGSADYGSFRRSYGVSKNRDPRVPLKGSIRVL